MKRLVLLLLVLILFIPINTYGEEQDIAHNIWFAMGEAGNMDMSKAWEVHGLFSFGETTADGEVTLFMTDDNLKIAKSVSWRNYPTEDTAITEQFFPMLKCLLLKLDREESEETIASWIDQVLPVVLLARQNNLFFRSAEKQFHDMTIFVEYDNKYTQLYSLITCTETNDWFTQE